MTRTRRCSAHLSSTLLLNILLKSASPYGTMNLLFWGEEVLAKLGEQRTVAGLPCPSIRSGAARLSRLRRQVQIAIAMFVEAPHLGAGSRASVLRHCRGEIDSSFLRLLGPDLPHSNRYTHTIRIARKLLKTLSRVPVYPIHYGAGICAINLLGVSVASRCLFEASTSSLQDSYSCCA